MNLLKQTKVNVRGKIKIKNYVKISWTKETFSKPSLRSKLKVLNIIACSNKVNAHF